MAGPSGKKQIRVLIPFDFSAQSQATLDFALSLRAYADFSCLLFHVVASGEVDTFANLGSEPGDELARRVREAETRLDAEIASRRRNDPDLPLEGRAVSGIPFKEICRAAAEEGADLIVIGTHGRTGLSHMLIGSTAERVVQHASCPVLSFRPPMN